MKQKDYYIILGVERSESSEGIKAAFRKLAKRYHPDRSGEESTRIFQEILEAYETLSDPESRRTYTEKLRIQELYGYRSESVRPRANGHRRRAGNGFGAQGRRHQMFDEILSEMFRDIFGGRSAFRNSFDDPFDPFRPGEVDIELVLSRREADRGGVIPIRIRIPSTCPMCIGTGETLPFICPVCGGKGGVGKSLNMRVKIAPGTRDGSVIKGFVAFGSGEVLIRIKVKVRDSA